MGKDYCQCDTIECVSTDIDDFGQWDVCSKCGKPIEDTYEYFNHYDGEDHCFYQDWFRNSSK